MIHFVLLHACVLREEKKHGSFLLQYVVFYYSQWIIFEVIISSAHCLVGVLYWTKEQDG